MTSDATTAERITRRRARLAPVLAVIFISNQAVYFSARASSARLENVKLGAWLFSMAALLVLLASGGGLFRNRNVRALINDEGTRANRAEAYGFGFWAVMLACLGLYLLSFYEIMSVRHAVHLIITAGVGAALLRFGVLERRALR